MPDSSLRSKLLPGIALIILAISLLYTLLPELPKSGDRNLYTHQAQAFLHLQADIATSHYDVATYNGRYYVPFPPFPAVVLLPFVAVFGVVGTRPVIVAVLLAILSVFIFGRILCKLAIERRSAIWLTAAFFMGTGYWYVLANTAGVWFFAHVIAITCVLLAINEALGGGRSWLVGLLIGLAFLSRQLNLFTGIFLLTLLWQRSTDRPLPHRLLKVFAFTAPVTLAIVAYLAFNWIRFGNPLDTGYGYFALPGFLQQRVERHGLFSLAYVPFNFVHLFLQGFDIHFAPPTFTSGLEMSSFGTSITFASPFLFAAFAARWPRHLLWAAWLSIFIIVLQLLTYFVNGWVQVNTQRYALDFIPIVMVLAAVGTKHVDGRWWKAAVIYAITLNILALVVIPIAGRLF
ncbi:MAG: glycosyl transferase family 39 [Chloroflexota bacterium]